jgi:hypothetical protein
MDILATLALTNRNGLYSLLAIFLLILLYLMRPKPVRKVIPSLIFLETRKNRHDFNSFFKRFVKDWLFIVHMIILLLLILAIAGLAAQFNLKKMDKQVIFVIDASASSKANDDGEIFGKYIQEARKNVGASNTIILAKNSPEVIAFETNPINAVRILSGLRPTDSTSNLWDAMMIASEMSTGTVIVLSDFIDTNGKDMATAKKLLEAKGSNVEFLNLRKNALRNLGIVNYAYEGETLAVEVRNFGTQEETFRTPDRQEIQVMPLASAEFTYILKEGVNKVEIETGDALRSDDALYFYMPKTAELQGLYISNGRQSNIYSALSSIRSIKLSRADPPIVQVGDKKLYVIDDMDYSVILPGTIDQIRTEVQNGASLIIAVQEGMQPAKLGDLLPVEMGEFKKQDVSIINTADGKMGDIAFGQSSRYFESVLMNNNTVIIAMANDKQGSPVISMTRYGKGKILYYGIVDEYNSFRASTQYPLFWIYAVEELGSQSGLKDTNKAVGEMIYGQDIRLPDNSRAEKYESISQVGIYKVDGEEVAVSLLNTLESDLNFMPVELSAEVTSEVTKVRQQILLAPFLVALIVLLSFLDILILKRRGEL